MKNSLIVILLLSAMCLLGCGGKSACDRALDHADSLLTFDVDSTEAAARLLDGQKPHLSDMSKRQRMRWQLLNAKIMNKTYQPFTSDSTMKEVALYYDRHGSANERMEAWYLLGCAYRDLGDAPQAIDILNKAEECADTTAKDCDYHTLSRICSQKDELYVGMMMPRERLSVIDEGVRFALMAKDTLGAISLYNQKSTVYDLLGDIDSSIIVNETAALRFSEIKREREAAMAIGENVLNYVRKGRLEDARKAIATYKRYSGLFNNEAIEDGWEIFYNYEGAYYLATNKLDSAIYFFRKQMAESNRIYDQYSSSQSLAELYKRTAQTDSVAKYAFRAMTFADSLYANVEASELIRANKLFNYGKMKENADKEKTKNSQLKYALVLLLLCSVILLSFSYIIYKRKQERHQSAIREMEQSYMSALSNLNSVYQNVLKENKVLNEKENGREETINSLTKLIENYQEILHIDKESETGIALLEIPVYAKFKELRLLGKAPKEEDWAELIDGLEETIPHFKEIVNKKQNLTKEEYYVCVLTRYHFQPMDIDFFMSCVSNSKINISMRRKRLLKKIWSKEGNGKDFDGMINAIS